MIALRLACWLVWAICSLLFGVCGWILVACWLLFGGQVSVVCCSVTRAAVCCYTFLFAGVVCCALCVV